MFKPKDVLVLGRVCLDLYPIEIDTKLENVSGFTKSIGASTANVAVGVAAHGHDVAIVTKVSTDSFGTYILRQFEDFGVDTQFISRYDGIQTVITFCEMFPPDHFPLYIYRNPTAPDMKLEEEDLPLEQIQNARILWVTSTGVSQEPSRTAHLRALKVRDRRQITILDLDYREMFWKSKKDAHIQVAKMLPYVTIAIGNLVECEMATGERDPQRAADALLDLGVELAIVKQGPEGVLAKTKNKTYEISPLEIQVVNGLGAGDAFGAAFCHGLLNNWEMTDSLDFANAAGAYAATQRECSTAMPTTQMVYDFLREAQSRSH